MANYIGSCVENERKTRPRISYGACHLAAVTTSLPAFQRALTNLENPTQLGGRICFALNGRLERTGGGSEDGELPCDDILYLRARRPASSSEHALADATVIMPDDLAGDTHLLQVGCHRIPDRTGHATRSVE